MVKQKVKEKEKEQAAKLKALRRELEEKIEEQLPEEMVEENIRVEVQKVDEGEPLEESRAKQVIESLLFAASKPLTAADIRKVIKSLTVAQITKYVQALKADYDEQGRSFEILEIANGFEISTRKDFAPWIMKVELQKKAKQVTQSALETLAILAYKQPITRAEIEELRGVDASGVVSTLTERGLIKIVGKKEVPGRPFLYGTTEKFLEHFGLKSLKELPDISEIQTLVDRSVSRDDLIGTTNIVKVQESEASQEASNETIATEQPAEESSEAVAQESSEMTEDVSEEVKSEKNEQES